MRVAICDDEKIYREETKNCIKEYDASIEVVEYQDGSELLDVKESFDLILLDIEMPQMDGMTAAKLLRKRKVDAEIVFLTSYEKYVYDAFDIRALQFLTKPLEKERLIRVLRMVEESLAKTERAIFLMDGEACYVKLKDIVYMEAYGDGVYVYDRMGLVYEARRETIKKWAEKLKGKGFVQIHRTHLISMFYIERFAQDEVKLKGRTEKLPVSRRHAADFKTEFLAFVNKHARIL